METPELVDPDDLPFVGEGEKRSFASTRKPRAVPDPLRQARGKRNRRAGNAAAREWAQLVGGENVGVLGLEDVRHEAMLWEVKSGPRPSLASLEKALDQVAQHAARRGLPYGVAWRLPDRPLGKRWLVVLRGTEWLDLHGSFQEREHVGFTGWASSKPTASRGASKQ